MSRIRVVSKRRISWEQKFWMVVIGMFLFISCGVVSMVLYNCFLKNRIDTLLRKSFSMDVAVLVSTSFYVFLGCALALIAVVYWVGWENLRFRLKQQQYRSRIVVKDYYRRERQMSYGKVFGQMDRFPSRKLDLAGKEKEELTLGILADPAGYAPATKIAFKDGKLDGVFVSYYATGEVESEVSYRLGKFHGPFCSYYGVARPHVEKFYKDGELDGVFKAYDDDGSIFFEISYKDGIADGPDKTFYRSGVAQYVDTYKTGKLVQRQTYDESGNLKYEENFS